MSTATRDPDPTMPYTRHPLGLPPGSVRAVLALMIAGLFWALIALPEKNAVPVPPFLYFLLGLIFLFFGSHGHSIGPHLGDCRSPLCMPAGAIRAVILIGTCALLGWLYWDNHDQLVQRLTPDEKQIRDWPTLLIATVGAFTFGHIVRLGPWRRTAGFQDLLATISLLAMIGLVVETVIVVFINPNIVEPLRLHGWETTLTAIVAFYFGARS